jgi:hypothetical protein
MLEPLNRSNIADNVETAVNNARHLAQNELNNTNKSRVLIDYSVGDDVFIKNINPSKTESRYSGPYPILELYTDRNAAKLDLGTYVEVFSFRRLKPALSREDRTVVNSIVDEQQIVQ